MGETDRPGVTEHGVDPRSSRPLLAVFGLMCSGLAAYLVYLGLDSPRALANLADVWVYNGMLFLAAAVCLLRAA